jgi:hypothetical protein
MLLPIMACGCAMAPPVRPLMVGSGQAFARPSDAARAARTGDTIRILPGVYADCAVWKADGLIIEGRGTGAVITGPACGDKGLFIVQGDNVTVRNLNFTNAKASSHNGAGIRVEGKNLTVENSRFLDNEDGILAADNSGSVLIVKNSSFRGNGNCIALCAHGIYANHIALLRIEHSRFEAQHVGHHIKSRAERTEIRGSIVEDGPDGSTSYLVDLPNGGEALISGNRFEKGPLSQNPRTAIAIAAEKAKRANPDGLIVIENNSFSNDTGVATVFVRNFADAPVTVRNNDLKGPVTAYGSGP